MWCLPTHKRPEKLKLFLDSLSGVDSDEKVLLMIWREDPRKEDYLRMDFPDSWSVYVGAEQFCRDKMNKAFAIYPNEAFYGLLTDDIRLLTPGMLFKMRREAEKGKFVWPDDGIWHERLSTHPVVWGEFVRALGFWAHPQFVHNGIDSVLFIIAQELGLSKYMGECRIEVLHPSFGTAETDETYIEGKALNRDFPFLFDLFLRSQLVPLLKKVDQQLNLGVLCQKQTA